MKTHFLFFSSAILILGCSSGDSSSTGNSGAASNFQMPDNVVEIDELHSRYDDDEGYQGEFGEKITVSGTLESVLFFSSGQEMKLSVSNGKDLFDKREISCLFKSPDILKKCLPGQQVVIEGETCDRDLIFTPAIENCRLLDVTGKSNAVELATADLDSGKKFDLLDPSSILTAKVKKVVLDGNKSDDHVFVDLDTKEPMCIQFNIYKHPYGEKIKSLQPGTTIRVLGSVLKLSTRLNYEGRVVLYNCQLLE